MRRAMAMFALVAVALAGCVGIPSSGGVVTGPLIDGQSPADIAVAPSGPTPGADQETILEDFFLAQRGPQGQYAIARQFLTKDFAQVWDPEFSATIRTGIPAVSGGPEADTMHYTVTSRAFVDEKGRYTETVPTSQTLDFTFEQEDGEWRISSAPNGVVLSQASFNLVFTERALYFFDPSYAFLVPDVRWFPSRATVPTRIVNELLAGPASWLGQGVVLNAFPIATALDTVTIESGTATVELSPEALAASAEDRDRMRQQLAATLDVTTVVMRVGGLVLTTPEVGPGAVKNPQVEGAVLIGTGQKFGFATVDDISTIDGISAKVVAAGATAATLSSDKQTAAILAPNGVSVVRAGVDAAALLDDRPGLVAPALDPFRFVWSVQASSAATLIAYETNGQPHAVSGLPVDAAVISIDISRDGTRLLVYASTSVGPKLFVGGIIRQQGSNVPTALGELLELPVASSKPIDATWVDDRTVATLSRGGEVSPINLVEIGGPSAALGTIADAIMIAGGNNSSEGLRVLRTTGEIWRAQGGSWVATGLVAAFVGTKQ